MDEKKHFDKAADSWDNNPALQDRAALVAAEIEKIIRNGRKPDALEFGAGTGLVSEKLYSLLNSVVLLDSSEGMVRQVRHKIESKHLNRMSVMRLELKNARQLKRKFNLVYTVMALHHVKNYKKLLSVFHELLERNGRLVIVDLVKEDGSFHAHLPEFAGHNGFDKGEIIADLLECGFTSPEYKIIYSSKKNRDNVVKEYPVFLLAAQKS